VSSRPVDYGRPAGWAAVRHGTAPRGTARRRRRASRLR